MGNAWRMNLVDWYRFLADVVDKFGPTAVGLAAVFVAYVTATRQLRKQEELAERESQWRASQDERRYKRRLYLDLVATADDCVREPNDEHKFAVRKLMSEARLNFQGNDAVREYLEELWATLLRLPTRPRLAETELALSKIRGLADICGIELSGGELTRERVAEIRQHQGVPTRSRN